MPKNYTTPEERLEKVPLICKMLDDGCEIDEIMETLDISHNLLIETMRLEGYTEKANYDMERNRTHDVLKDVIDEVDFQPGSYAEPKAYKVEYEGKKYLDVTEFFT